MAGLQARATGTFTVESFEPVDFVPAVETGLPTGQALMRKTFSGAIDGWSQTQFVYAFDSEGQWGSYVAMESFSGSIDGYAGTCNIAHSATAQGDAERQDEILVIVPHSGTGQLEGIWGSGSIEIDEAGTHYLHLVYQLS